MMPNNPDAPWENYVSGGSANSPAPAASHADAPWENYSQTPPADRSSDPAVAKMVANSPGIKEASNPLEALMAGWQQSDIGLATRGKMPDLTLPKNASFASRLSETIGQGVGDLPATITGGTGGLFAGAAAGAAVTSETGPGAAGGAAIGGAVGAGAGAMALPQAIRETLMDYYQKDDIRTSADFMHVLSHSAWNTFKAGAIGAVAGPLGLGGGKAAEALGGGLVARSMGETAGFVSGATGAQAAFDHKMPDPADTAAAAVTMFGLSRVGAFDGGRFVPSRAGVHVMSNTDTIYRQTGIPPWQQAQMTKQDPGLHEEVLAKDVNGNPVLPRFNAMRPDEPEPFKTNAHKLQDEHNEEVSGLTGQAFVNAHVENLLPMVRQLEGSGDDAVSPAGAVGRYQIMPGTARQYGFDPALLKDPAYNERAARTVLADLVKRFHGDREAILIAYNAGPGRAFKFLADGRDRSQLPAETQRYLAHAEELKGISGQPLEKLAAEPVQEKGIDYEKASFGDLVADVQRKVGLPVTRSASPLLGFETDLDFARRVDRRMIAEGLLDSKKDLTLEDMARQTKGSDSRLLHFMREGPVTFNGFDAPNLYGKGDGPSFKDVIDDIQKAGGTTEEFNAYRLAARTVEKAQQGIDLGVLDGGVKQAQAILSHPEAAKYAPINAKMQTVKNGMLEYVRQSGLRNPDQIEAMQRLNTSHVSVRKLEGDTKAFQFSGKSGLLKARDPFFRMTGGKKDKIVDTVLADIDNMSRMQSAADKNIAARFATDNPERMRLAGITLVSKPKGDADAALPDDLKGMAPFVEDKALTKTQFPVWRDGKKWVYEAHDEYTARLFRMAEGPGEVNFILKALQLPAKIARAGITTDPSFGGRVVLKHGNTAFVFSEHHPPPFVTALRGVLDSFGHGDAFWEFARNGGLQSTMVNMDRNLVQAEAYHTLETEGRLKKLWNTVSHPIELGQMWNDALSNSGRIGEMKTLIARGVRPDKATMAARKDFLDFQEQFASGALNTMAKYVPFFKADILGLKQGQEGLRPRNLAQTSLAMSAIVAAQIGLYAANRMQDSSLPENEKFVNLPQWERDRYFITPQINGVRMHLGLPFNYQPTMGIALNRYIEHAIEKDPHAFDGMVTEMAKDLLPSPIPTAGRPSLEQISNHNFFTGLPLIPDSLKDQTADMQFTPHTSATAKNLSAILGSHRGIGVAEVSPIVIQNYVEELTGTLGSQALGILDMTQGETPQFQGFTQLPFVQSFFVRHPDMSAKLIEDFYAAAKPLLEASADKSAEIRAGDLEAATIDMQKAQKIGTVRAFSQALAIQRRLVQGIGESDKMSYDEKRQLIEPLVNDAIVLSKIGLGFLTGDAADEHAVSLLEQHIQSDEEQAQKALQ